VVLPEALDVEGALKLLLAEPLLIRRPLMQRPDGARMVGFETEVVDRFVGLSEASVQRDTPIPASLEGCAAVKAPCPTR